MPAINLIRALPPLQTFTAPLINYQTGQYHGDISACAERIEVDRDGIVTIFAKSLIDVLPLSYAIRSAWDLGNGPIKFNVNSHLLIVTEDDEQQFVEEIEQKRLSH